MQRMKELFFRLFSFSARVLKPKAYLILIFWLFCLFLITPFSAWGASGYVTLSASPDPAKSCCIGASSTISITGSYEVTADNTCTWDIYTWASWCSIAIFDFDGAKSYDWISPYRIGIKNPISWSINTANYQPGTKHTFTVSIVDLNSDGSRAGTIAEDSVDFTICGNNTNCNQPSCPDCGKQCGPDMGSSASIVSGNLYHDQTLFQLPNSKPAIDFTIAYNSLDTYTGSLGKGWTHSFNINITKQGSSIILMKQDGKRVNFTSSSSSNTYIPDVQTGEHAVIIQNPDSTYTLTYKDGTAYAFDSKGRLTKLQDLNQNAIILSYTGDNLTSISDSSGRTIRISITTTSGKISSITDPAGKVYTFSYTGDSLSSVTDPVGQSFSFAYDSSGRMLTKTDPNGNKTIYAYDSQGRITQSQDPEGKTKAIAYDTNNNKATVTEKDGGIWKYTYDSTLHLPLQITDPQGNITQKRYDSGGNLTAKQDPDGSITKYTYDADGNMTSTTDALNQTTLYTYNIHGQITSVTDPKANKTLYEYDVKGNLTKTTDPTNAATQYQYDSKGNITKITNANNQTTSLTYDQYNNLTKITDPQGASISFAYDINGNMTSQTDASGNTTYFEYNTINQLTKVTDPSGNTTRYAYDKNGNKTSSTDANGNTTRYEYNYKGKLTKVTDTLADVTTYGYGGSGCASCGTTGGDNLTSISDAKGHTTTYGYDTLGRLTKETDYLGNTITYRYDSKGNLTSKKDQNGNTTTYTYDQLNRLTKKAYPDSTQETYMYNLQGSLMYVSNQYISYTFTYDAKGRPLTVKDSRGNNMAIAYQYDLMGNKISMTIDGKTITYAYDTNNRLTTITDPVARSFSFAYDKAGRRIKLAFPNGVQTTYTYDNSGRLTNLIHKTSNGEIIASYVYTMDKVGNRLTKTEPDVKYNYSYDNIYRLTQAVPIKLSYKRKGEGEQKEHEAKAEYFSYDAVGNRLRGPATRDFYSYNQINQLTEDRKNSYEYDKNGNLTKKTEKDDDGKTETWTYSYDYENRLIKVVKQESDETKTVSFKYDPFGRRIEKKVEEVEDGKTETKTYSYVYDNEDIILEYNEKNEITRYVHGPGIDEPISIERKGSMYYYHADGLGSIIALTDTIGKVQQTYEYDSFGNLKDQKNKIKQPYTYTGREWDRETGLYYYRARYYDAKVGRFISFDPIVHPANGPPKKKACSGSISYPSFESLKGNPQKLNPYVYVQNRPTVLTDPSGFGPPSECSFYQDLCCQGDSYACSAYKICKSFGDNKLMNCIRNCLIDAYKECQTAQCVVGDHEVCWTVCLYKWVAE